jgi:phosphonoacetaldehyde hydrolase
MLRRLLPLSGKSPRFFSTVPLRDPNSIWASQKVLSIPQASRVQAAHFDVAGTVVDQFCIAPFLPFQQAFADIGFPLTIKQILGPMGMSKEKHIEHLLKEIEDKFFQKYHRHPNQNDVKEIFDAFMLMLPDAVKQRTELTPYTDLALKFILQHNIKLALTSGYPRTAADLATVKLRKLFQVDASTTADEVDGSRIAMIRRNNEKLGVEIAKTILFTDATNDVRDVRSVKDQSWVIAVLGSSVCFNITSTEMEESICEDTLLVKRGIALQELLKSGPHAVIEDMSQAPLAIAAISAAIEKGLDPAATDRIKIEFPDVHLQQVSGMSYRR